MTPESIAAPYLPVRFGASIETLRETRPELAPSGWSSGVSATWLAPGLEVETEAGDVRVVTLEFAPGEASDEVEERVEKLLGPGVSCGALPPGVRSFDPRLWLVDDGAVTVLRKQRVVQLRVERPAPAAFRDAIQACGE